jgi:hypothetical protein
LLIQPSHVLFSVPASVLDVCMYVQAAPVFCGAGSLIPIPTL